MLPNAFASLLILWASLCHALPHRVLRNMDNSLTTGEKGIHVTFQRKVSSKHDKVALQRRGAEFGMAGLGDDADVSYSVPISFGNLETAVDLDTGSSDLWTFSTACKTIQCSRASEAAYPLNTFQPSGVSVNLTYGDSTTGTHAAGPIGQDTALLAGLSISDQYFVAVNDTNNDALLDGSGGIFGLGFPGGSEVQAAIVNKKFDDPLPTNDFIFSTATNGPLLARLASNGAIEQPMFSISLQRDTISEGGSGMLSVGTLPPGVDNSSFTWVPVRLYSVAEGGLSPPTTAPLETYPLRWEIALDAVFLDGKELPTSNLSATDITNPSLSALIDTGNSIIRGPQDVVNTILTTVSPSFGDSAGSAAIPTYPCSTPHTLAFQIGGQMFPVDPRDFVSPPSEKDDLSSCQADNVVATDPPSPGTLFSWSLGDTFLKSAVVAFYYGNLTNPSVDPPRIGFLSTMPANASALLVATVQAAANDGGDFELTSQPAPTGPTAAETATSPSAIAVYSTTLSANSASGTNGATSSSGQTPQRSGASNIDVMSTLFSILSIGALTSVIIPAYGI